MVLWDRNGDFEVGPRLMVPAPADANPYGGWPVALADADGYGRVDVVTWTSRGLDTPGYVVVHRNAGAGTFTTAIVATVQSYFSAVAVLDIDGDPDVDLVSNESDRRQVVMVNRGDGSFSDPQRVATPHELVAVADLNGDGRADYVVDEFRSVAVLMSRDC